MEKEKKQDIYESYLFVSNQKFGFTSVVIGTFNCKGHQIKVVLCNARNLNQIRETNREEINVTKKFKNLLDRGVFNELQKKADVCKCEPAKNPFNIVFKIGRSKAVFENDILTVFNSTDLSVGSNFFFFPINEEFHSKIKQN